MPSLFVTAILLLCLNLKAQALEINGTWVNVQLYDAVLQGRSVPNIKEITPRCIHFGSDKKLTVEYQFEQKSRTVLVEHLLRRGDTAFFDALRMNFAVVNDSIMIILNSRPKITFRKIGTHPVLGSGVEELLRMHFWGSNKKWMIVAIKNGISMDTLLATIGIKKIYGNGNSPIFKHYEFTDLEKHKVGEESLFGIVFFTINKNSLADSSNVFAIKKKSDGVILLYKGDTLSYQLIPLE